MNTKENLESVFEKLLKKNPKMNFNSEAKVSDILLLRDYFAKLEEAKLALNIDTFYISDPIFHNLFLDISPEWKDELPSYSDFTNVLVKSGIDLFYLSENSLMGNLIYLFITWEIFKNKPELSQINNGNNPYKSVIKVILNKHLIYRLHGFFYINDLIVYKFRYNKLPSLDDDFLDFIDAKCPTKRHQNPNVPNAEQAILLWEEFQKKR